MEAQTLQKWQIPDLSIIPFAVSRISSEVGYQGAILPFYELGAVVIIRLGGNPSQEFVPMFREIHTPDGNFCSASDLYWIRVSYKTREAAEATGFDFEKFLSLATPDLKTTKTIRKRAVGSDFADTEVINHSQLQRKAASKLFTKTWPNLAGEIKRLRRLRKDDLFGAASQNQLWLKFSLDCAANGCSPPELIDPDALIREMAKKGTTVKTNPWSNPLHWALVCGWIQFEYYSLKAKELNQALPANSKNVGLTDEALNKIIHRDLELRLAPETGSRDAESSAPNLTIPEGDKYTDFQRELAEDTGLQIICGRTQEKQNPSLALEFYLAAARNKDAEGQFHAGRLLIEGDEPLRNPSEGICWIKLAVEGGQPDAQRYLGELLMSGFLIRKNRSKGLALLKQAAESGNEDAILALGRAYWEGNGVEKDVEKAKQLIRDMAGKGNERAAFVMAECLSKNSANSVDWLEAYRWTLTSIERKPEVSALQEHLETKLNEAAKHKARVGAAALREELKARAFHKRSTRDGKRTNDASPPSYNPSV